jgi:hypothetical protein
MLPCYLSLLVHDWYARYHSVVYIFIKVSLDGTIWIGCRIQIQMLVFDTLEQGPQIFKGLQIYTCVAHII